VPLAFLDESLRSRYIICVVTLAAHGDAETLRKLLRNLRKSGQRSIHAKHESDSRRRKILGELVKCDLIKAWIYTAPRPARLARDICLEMLCSDLIDNNISQLVLDGGESKQNQRDRTTLQQALFKLDSTIQYRHSEFAKDACLWAADMVAWAFGAGGEWRQRIRPVIVLIRNT
jgi:hypothetical protein